MKSKTGAFEFSMTTVIVIVLGVTMLVLGLIFIKQIFSKGTNAIDDIDEKVQLEINKLFSEEGKKIVVYPKEREIRMKKGTDGGFGFSILNKDMDAGEFSYEVVVEEVASSCQLSEEEAEELIVLGKSGSRTIGSGDALEDAILVKFQIPEAVPLCLIRYSIEVDKDDEPYTSSSIDLKIV